MQANDVLMEIQTSMLMCLFWFCDVFFCFFVDLFLFLLLLLFYIPRCFYVDCCV